MLQYNKQELGRFLKKAREEAGFTQKDIADRLGYASAQFISNIERGLCPIPLPVLSKMTKLYKLNPVQVTDVILKSQKQLLSQFLRGTGKRHG